MEEVSECIPVRQNSHGDARRIDWDAISIVDYSSRPAGWKRQVEIGMESSRVLDTTNTLSRLW